MKTWTLALLPILAITTALSQEAPKPFADWRHLQTVTPAAPGLVRLEIAPSTHGAAEPELRDLRLVSPSGVETPYLLEWPQHDTVVIRPVAGFRTWMQDDKTFLEMSPPGEEPIRAVTLQAATPTFLKAATLEGSQDGATWQALGEPGVLFRQQDGSSRLRLTFTPGIWKQLRITADDRRSPPAAFSGASVELLRPASPTVPEDFVVERVEELEGRTRLHLVLQTPHAWLGVLRLQTTEPLFNRRVTVAAPESRPGALPTVLADATIFRLKVEDLDASSLEIPVHKQAQGGKLILTIENGSSPPLKIQAVQGTRYPVHLTFAAQEAGAWKLFSGNPLATAPYYDLAALLPRLKGAQTSTAVVGPLIANPDYRKDAALTRFAESGSVIDTAGWRRRKPVILQAPGVQLLELDLEASCHHSGRDLRLVQDGRQLPYLVLPNAPVRHIDLTITSEPDPKRPRWSRWKVELPHANMPLRRLELTTPSRIFERSLRIMEELPGGSSSGPARLTTATVVQVRNVEDGGSIVVDLQPPIQGRQLWIETDNGDNTPMQIASSRGAYNVAQLKFQVPSPDSPVHLYYDHPSVPAPRYDLRLAERELNVAVPSTATLGAEELLRPVKSRNERESGAGSVALWAALAAVAAGLLWLVVKLLPEQSSGNNPG